MQVALFAARINEGREALFFLGAGAAGLLAVGALVWWRMSATSRKNDTGVGPWRPRVALLATLVLTAGCAVLGTEYVLGSDLNGNTSSSDSSSESSEDQSDCDPNYTGACLDPNASDYDCEGGSGDGPEYTGTVTVVGDDVYGLDRDGDGTGCD